MFCHDVNIFKQNIANIIIYTRIPRIGRVTWQTEVKQIKFVEFISSGEGYFRKRKNQKT